MQNLFKNKLFIILSLFIILIIFISSSCFAFEDSVEINYPTDIFNENVTGFIFIYQSLGVDYIDLWTFDSSAYIVDIDESNGYPIIYKPVNTYIKFYRYDFNTNSFNYIRQDYYTDTRYNITLPISFYNINNPNNLPVSIINNPTLVFQGAPQAQGEVVQVELMKPTQVQEIPQQIVAVVMIVLPIFLGIFGVLLVLYLIKSKNLLQL